MATVEVIITGDLADLVDQDFAQAQVRLRANASDRKAFIADRDADKIRVLDERWVDVAEDGTFAFNDVIASTDTIVAGTLQYYVDIRCRAQGGWHKVTLGPYALTGDADLSDLEADQPTGVQRTSPDDINLDVLAEAAGYTDEQVAAHEAAANPHLVYARLTNSAGAPTGGRLILVGAGGQFPPVEVGSILIYGGN